MKDNLKKIILEGQENRVAYYKRDFSLTYPEEINTIIGLRRSGKTYFVFSQIEALLQNGLPPTEYIKVKYDLKYGER